MLATDMPNKMLPPAINHNQIYWDSADAMVNVPCRVAV